MAIKNMRKTGNSQKMERHGLPVENAKLCSLSSSFISLRKVPRTPVPAAPALISSLAARGLGRCVMHSTGVKVLEREHSPASEKLSSRWE